MKSVISFLCLVLCLCMLTGCAKQQSDNEINEMSETELVITDPFIEVEPVSLEPREIFYISKNVYTGKLLEFEYCDGFDYEKREGSMNLRVEVDGVYKGEHTVGDIIEQVFEYGYWNDKNNPKFWQVGARYMFMLETDDNIERIRNDVRYNSKYNVLKFFDENYTTIDNKYFEYEIRYPNVTGWTYRHRFDDTTYSLFDHIFILESDDDLTPLYSMYLDPFYSHMCEISGLEHEPLDQNSRFPGNFLYYLYTQSEDVYYGEIIGGKGFYSVALYESMDYYKSSPCILKIKVMTVYKGDLKPGDIIEDLCWIEDRPNENAFMPGINYSIYEDKGLNPNRTFFFTGGNLDFGYTLEQFS